jgi:hypothetical protein
MAFPHLKAAYQAALYDFPALTLLSQNLLITVYFRFFFSLDLPKITPIVISEVGNKVGIFTSRRDTSHPRFNFTFLWVGNDKLG